MTKTTDSAETDPRFTVSVRGINVDGDTRCRHYHTPRDVVAIRVACCDVYYPCYHCHAATTTHESERIEPSAFDDSAVLCGVCAATLTVSEYLSCGDACPQCGSSFNPGCRSHRHRCFAIQRT
jgi:uncharacterized CHY-type Zn-finger protein